GRERLLTTLSRAEAKEPTRHRAGALTGAGALSSLLGDQEAARHYMEECLEIARFLGDTAHMAGLLHNLAIVAMKAEDLPRARSLLEEAYKIEREHNEGPGGVPLLLGHLSAQEGDTISARALYIESLEMARESGDELGVAHCLHSLGNLAYKEGDLA